MTARIYTLEINTIARLLAIGGVDKRDATRRAAQIVEGLEWISFAEFALSCRGYPCLDSETGKVIPLPIPEYCFGDTGFSVNKAEDAETNDARWFGGTGLDRGNLVFLSHVIEIANRVIPDRWLKSRPLRLALKNPQQHLNTLEEIWWLGRWSGIESVEVERSLIHGQTTSVDWSLLFDQGKLRVNLEVKRILRDSMRHVRGLDFTSQWFNGFCLKEVLPKFPVSGPSEINILAISLFGEIDRQVQEVLSEWLANGQTQIDGILVATRESRRRSAFDHQLYTSKSKLIQQLLRPLDAEDSTLAFVVEYPVEIPGLNLVKRSKRLLAGNNKPELEPGLGTG